MSTTYSYTRSKIGRYWNLTTVAEVNAVTDDRTWPMP